MSDRPLFSEFPCPGNKSAGIPLSPSACSPVFQNNVTALQSQVLWFDLLSVEKVFNLNNCKGGKKKILKRNVESGKSADLRVGRCARRWEQSKGMPTDYPHRAGNSLWSSPGRFIPRKELCHAEVGGTSWPGDGTK